MCNINIILLRLIHIVEGICIVLFIAKYFIAKYFIAKNMPKIFGLFPVLGNIHKGMNILYKTLWIYALISLGWNFWVMELFTP
jgi:hypothetical protein